MATSFPHPDNLYFQAAQGWLELGNPSEAREELDRIASSLHAHPDVLELRWHLSAQAKTWEACIDIARAIIEVAPERAEAWIHCSFALHELKRTQEAYDRLLPCAERFPAVWTVFYNLACYCAQLGRLDECHVWFKKAKDIDGDAVNSAAVGDPDLKPYWERFGR